jgi:hypothetical protein
VPTRRRDLAFVLLVAWAAVFAAWSPSLSGSFLKDDESNFAGNPVVHAPASWPSFFYRKSANSRDKELTVAYRPLATLSYALTARLAGLNPFFFHLLDAAGHAANAALVLLIGFELCRSLPAAAAGALLFALHPAQAESVSYISGARPSVFSLLFCLLAWREHGKNRRARALGFLLAGAFFKESALALPLALAARDWAAEPRRRWKERARVLGPYFALAFLFTVARSLVLGRTTDSGLYGGTIASHLAFALTGLAVDARSALWPYGQRLCYSLAENAGPAPVAAGALLAAATAAALAYGARVRAAWLAALAWTAAFLLPVSNLVIPVSTLAADRYLYASFAGLAWMAALAVSRLPKRWAAVPAAVLAVWLLPLCLERQWDWQSAFNVDAAAHAAGTDACADALLMVDYFNWGMDARARSLAEEGLSRRPSPAIRAYLGSAVRLLDRRAK